MSRKTKTWRRSSTALGMIPIAAASVVWLGGTAMAQDQQHTWDNRTSESSQETTMRTVRRYEETTAIVGRGVTGDVYRPPANELWPEYSERERLWYNLSQMPGL